MQFSSQPEQFHCREAEQAYDCRYEQTTVTWQWHEGAISNLQTLATMTQLVFHSARVLMRIVRLVLFGTLFVAFASLGLARDVRSATSMTTFLYFTMMLSA